MHGAECDSLNRAESSGRTISQAAGHSVSHPHLVQQSVLMLQTGILAHESALKGGGIERPAE